MEAQGQPPTKGQGGLPQGDGPAAWAAANEAAVLLVAGPPPEKPGSQSCCCRGRALNHVRFGFGGIWIYFLLK